MRLSRRKSLRRRPRKVINLMDALRKSISDGQKPAAKKPSQSARPRRELPRKTG